MQQHNIYQSDCELASACARGDRSAQFTLFERVKNPMFGVCLRFAHCRATAEDLLQEGFIRVFRDISQYRGEGSLNGWVRQIFVRTGIDYFHRQKKLPEIVELEWLESMAAAIPNDLQVDDPQSAIALLQTLPPGFRTVINLSVLEGKSHEEIGRALGITPSTSRSQLARAKRFLKKIIQKSLVFI